MKILSLLEKINKEDMKISEQEILAPVQIGSAFIQTKVANMIRKFAISEQRSSGIKIFKATDYENASYIREASEGEIRSYLDILPKIILILLYQQDGCWYAFPAHQEQFKRVGPATVVSILNTHESCDRFDYVIARYDGYTFWYDDVDYRVDPDKQEHMRSSLMKQNWGKIRNVDDPNVYILDYKGLTLEDSIAYQIAARRLIQDSRSTIEQRLEKDLLDVNAKLSSVIEKGVNIEVKWINASGQIYTTVIQKNDFRVVTAGICVSGEDRKFDLKSLVGVVNYAESHKHVVRVGQGHMEEDSYFNVHPEPKNLGDRGNRWRNRR